MKAISKATGTVYNVVELIGDDQFVADNGNTYFRQQFKLVEDIDWDDVRINAAISIINGLIASDYDKSPKKMADAAVRYADALVQKLKVDREL